MALYGIKEQKKQVYGELEKKAKGSVVKTDCQKELQRKVAQEREAANLRYDCETGFHYMEQA